MGRPKGSKNKHKIAIEERFWEKVDIKGNDECWEWLAYVHPSGYGTFNIERKMYQSHRVAWMLTYGEIPKGDGYHGTCVCHHCDNSICCNPSHLFLGTQKDNVKDRDNKSRGVIPDNRGENHGLSKLNADDVRKIRKIWKRGYSQSELAEMFGVSYATVYYAATRRSWAWLE
jgi:hypothetical protein